MSAELRIGTAGWSIPSAEAGHFPGEGSHLERYARLFNAAEINSSFHRPHRLEIYRRWADAVPDGFRFSVKCPRTATHDRRLVDCGDLLDRFVGEVAGLGEKLGAVLVQLPPSLAFDPAIAETFFAELHRRIAVPVVCEPRHASWFGDEAQALLASLNVARVAADPARVAGAETPGGWAGLVYFRLHGSPRIYRSAYGPERCELIAAQLADATAAGAPAWCIFDNTGGNAAVGDALATVSAAERRRLTLS